MLEPRQKVVARVRWIRKIDSSHRIGVQQRGGLNPVFVGRVDLHELGTGTALRATQHAPIGFPGDRIGQRLIGEREHAFRVKKMLAITLGPPVLREPIIDKHSRSSANPVENAVENLFALLVLIETEPKIIMLIAGRLRHTVRICGRDVAGQRI